MITNLLYRVSQLERKLANTVIIGTIHDVDYDEALVRVESGDFISGWLPWLTTRAHNDTEYWAPEVGEQVVMFSPDGEPEQGVVLPALYQQQYDKLANNPDIHIKKYKDQTTFSYNRKDKKLTIAIAAGGNTELISDGGINIKGDVTIQGNLKASGDITDKTRSMAADREVYNEHTHKVPGCSESKPTGKIQ
ncbi:phage baseplate assembly protein V [Endozoicomonas sp. SM1973]|uniref:Phage baseplate assembly protein V n=1 Tax=Spartinivicinus marinus TaxID=2994442 RepID=A0A853HT31_9GAMM|nr:phage baseplate assembly protein V [Spartinivicinus marinus]MCX4026619.1 phage baseplate assembly protein V [Spartinivicinus marinus]NYZ64453.1 phage baseplate assembly protein V [Spartinivicinus marinus]